RCGDGAADPGSPRDIGRPGTLETQRKEQESGLVCCRFGLTRMQQQMLDSPVLRFSRVQLVFADALDLMHPVKLTDSLSGRSKPAEHIAFEVILVNLAAGIGTVEELLAL